jgi:hypothetical protein
VASVQLLVETFYGVVLILRLAKPLLRLWKHGRIEKMAKYKIEFIHRGWTTETADSEAGAKMEAMVHLALHGWGFVNDEELILEVERVYETRWDCMVGPEGVRRKVA